MTAIVAAFLVTATALGFNAWLLRNDAAADVLTPKPERVVQNFIGMLTARREQPAAQYVEGNGTHVAETLKPVATTFRARHGFARVMSAETRREGDRAEVRARIRTTRDGTIERRFWLARDSRTRLWKIAGFEPLD